MFISVCVARAGDFGERQPLGLVLELPDDVDLLLEDEPEWEALVASLSDV